MRAATSPELPNSSAETATAREEGVRLNDVQSQLNATRVAEVLRPENVEAVQAAVRLARKRGMCVSQAGGRHSMGAQQFGTGNLHLDLTGLDFVERLDAERGLVTVGAGIMWPQLIADLRRLQDGRDVAWTIRVKQTGVDSVTIGGSLSANMHGRGLRLPPFVNDIESFDMVDAHGEVRHCSRSENSELFSLAIGGYGLFGVVVRVTLRLARRFKVRAPRAGAAGERVARACLSSGWSRAFNSATASIRST